jgi:phosphatidylserine/phosphatidylglycerophosphate/cardiolipin synthase-like enzyme
MPENDDLAFRTLAARTSGHADLVARIAAPLWARVGRTVDAAELSWARSLLGDDGPHLLVKALQEFETLDLRTRTLSARGVSRFLSSLLGDSAPADTSNAQSPELVWTLPQSHSSRAMRGQTYLDCCLRLISEAKERLTLVSPIIDPAGIGALTMPVLGALSRGVAVRLLVHDGLNIGTPTSRTLEELRREAERAQCDLSVFSADAGVGRDRFLNPLFHAKLVIRDDLSLLLGSANLTSYALRSNFEAGVLLGKAAAKEALFILDGILNSKTVYLVFGTKTR